MLRAVRSCSILAAILAAIPSTVCDQVPLNGAGTVEIPVVSGNVTNTGCHEACALLQGHNHADVLTFYPELPENYTQRFYSVQQREQRPVCVAEPTSADGVALVVNVVTQSKCPFAIKSGGHSLAPGTCNRNGGLVLDLRRLNAVKVSEDAQTVSLGPGSLWGDVYSTLEPLGLTVPGGRVDSVGVGGFILGGGISFYSRKYGWAMDNVKNFEVVLPNGTLANVNRKQSSHPDLFFALRGGGSNFGVVTRFDMQAYPNDLQWGGTDVRLLADLPDIESRMGAAGETFSWTLHSAAVVASRWAQRLAVWFGLGSNTRDVIDAFIGLVAEGQSDNAAHAYIFLSWVPEVKAYLTGSTYVYSKNTPDPEVFKNFTQGRMLKTTRRLANMSSFTHEVDEMNPRDMRQYFYTSTYKLNADLISHMFDIFIDETRPFRQVVPNALVSSNYQLVSKDQIETSAKLGGNAFGLRVEDGPLFLFSVTVAYPSAEDDDRIRAMVSRIMTRAAEVGTRMNLHHRFIYPNYATVDQNVFSGFSPDSQRKLREIQQRYDPRGLFASLQPEHLGLRDTEALGSE